MSVNFDQLEIRWILRLSGGLASGIGIPIVCGRRRIRNIGWFCDRMVLPE